jgi:hypothetical protein
VRRRFPLSYQAPAACTWRIDIRSDFMDCVRNSGTVLLLKPNAFTLKIPLKQKNWKPMRSTDLFLAAIFLHNVIQIKGAIEDSSEYQAAMGV